MELEHDKFWEVEQIFKKTLMTIPHVQLWSVYLDYIRRINNLITDTTGKARQVVTQTYEFVLQNVGIDKDAGLIWQDYIKFLKSGPGTPGGSSWQDGQKMDSLRKAYQNAVRIPTQTVNALWTEYNTFETTLNKTTVSVTNYRVPSRRGPPARRERHPKGINSGNPLLTRNPKGRQLLNQQSPHFMTAKQQNVALEAIVSKINRTTIPRLPPLPGYEGYEKFAEQLNLWKKWIDYEKDDPLVLRDSDKKEEKEEYKKRVMYAYKQAFMALRFVPDVWCDAAEFCFANDMNKEGDEILIQGIEANPESCLLAFKRADRVELSTIGEADATKRGATVRAPYNTLLDALYALEKKITARGEKKVSEIKTTYTVEPMETEPNDDEDDEAIVTVSKEHKEAMEARVKAAQADTNAQIDLLKKTITAGWIALMRAIRRVQGKGKQGDEGTGMRQIFGEARKRGRLTSDFYIESGLLEHVCYQDPAGTKILERGVKLFPEDENIALVYIKHLISKHDTTNARATFETVVSKLTSKPENVHKARPLFLYFHDYESKFGELSQISKLEARMTALYPDDPKLQLFAHRFESIDAHDKIFDPTTVQHIISPATQAIPKALGGETTTLASVEVPAEKSPVPDMSYAFSNSPKRPYQHDESDNELYPPRKFQRGESPLKGAAGRRLAAAARTGSPSVSTEIPAAIKFILRLLPNSAASQPLASRIDINKLTTIMRGVDTSRPPPATLPVHPPLPPSLANAIQPPLQSPQQRTGSESWSQPPAPAPQTGYGQPYAVPPVPPSQPPTAANSYGVTPPLPVQTGQYGTPVPPPQPPSATAGYPGYPPPQPQYQQPHGQQPGQFPYPPPPQHNWQGPPSAGAYPPQGYQGYR